MTDPKDLLFLLYQGTNKAYIICVKAYLYTQPEKMVKYISLLNLLKIPILGNINLFKAEGTDGEARFLSPLEYCKLIALGNTTWCVTVCNG